MDRNADDELSAAEARRVFETIGAMGVLVAVTVWSCWQFGTWAMLGPGGTLRVAAFATLTTLLAALMLVLRPSVLAVPLGGAALVVLVIDGARNGEASMLAEVHGLAVVMLWLSGALGVQAVVMLAVEARRFPRLPAGTLVSRCVLRIFRGVIFFGAAQLVLSAVDESTARPWVLSVCCVVALSAATASFPLLVQRAEPEAPGGARRGV